MRVLFLDIDGVLNNHAYWKKIADEGIRIHASEVIDPENVKHLNRVIHETEAVIVISSTWRMSHSIDKIQRLLEKAGFAFPYSVIGCTSYYPEPTEEILAWKQREKLKIEQGEESEAFAQEIVDRLQVRGNDIQTWLHQVGDAVTSFAIVDDDSDMAHLLPRLVKTDSKVGLVSEDVDKLKALLLEDS